MPNHFNPDNDRLTVLSFGGGQDSTAILLMLIHDQVFRSKFLEGKLIVVFADTLNEHPHTYRHLLKMKALCKQHSIEFYWIRPGEGFHTESWNQGLDGHYQKYNVIMSKAMRNKSCTHGLKIQPIYNFLAHYVNEKYLFGLSNPKKKISLKDYATRFGRVKVLIGISFEESKRRIKSFNEPKWMEWSIEKSYPLDLEKMTRKDCQAEINSYGFEVPFPSNCIMCPFASKKEILWLHRNLPEQLKVWMVREQAKIDKWASVQAEKGKPNHSVSGGSKMLSDILALAIEEFGHLSNEELDNEKLSHGHCVLSSY